jgi:histidine ammonia-lyase
MGPYLPDDAVRAAMLARINVLARGHSAIRLEVVDHLVEMFNRGVIPRIPSLGSLGASGDLGPLACIALVATGSWQAVVEGEETSGGEALARVNLKPLELSYKEGLSLINGTSAMTGLGALNVADAQQLLASYHRVSVLTLEALRAKIKPFTPLLHDLKNHPGQIRSATCIFEYLKGSRLAVADDVLSERLKGERSSEASQGSDPIEDSYVLRCTPQILGPVIDTLDFAAATIDRELNATSDNPVILPSSGEIFHNGHFHGQYVSAAMDYLSIALTTLSNLADRRVDRLLSPHYNNGLPAFLCEANQGTRLGLMGVQFMATSATAENRSLCHPVSVQTLPSTGGFQDHVSMGLVAARRCRQILDNAVRIVACELLCACQAADIRGRDLLSPSSKESLACVREIVPYLEDDVILTPLLERLWHFLTDPASPLAEEHQVRRPGRAKRSSS